MFPVYTVTSVNSATPDFDIVEASAADFGTQFLSENSGKIQFYAERPHPYAKGVRLTITVEVQ